MEEKDTDMNVARAVPAFENKWNLNTLMIIAGILGGFIAYGYDRGLIEADIRENSRGLSRLETRVDRLETSGAILTNHDLRIGAVERDAVEAADAARETARTVNGLVSDVRVIREIVQRIEAGQNGARPAR